MKNVPAGQRKGLVFMGMGFELVGLMLGSLFLGEKIDQAYGTEGLGVAGLSMLVLIGWIYHLVILLQRYTRAQRQQDDSPKQGH